jgi:hypothetical protein
MAAETWKMMSTRADFPEAYAFTEDYIVTCRLSGDLEYFLNGISISNDSIHRSRAVLAIFIPLKLSRFSRFSRLSRLHAKLSRDVYVVHILGHAKRSD